MLKQRARAIAALVFFTDLALVAAAFVGAYWMRSQLLVPTVFPTELYPLDRYLPLLPLALVIWGFFLLRTGQYRSHRTIHLLQEAADVIRICAISAVVFILSIYALRLDFILLGNDLVSRLWIFLFALLSMVLLLSQKLALRVTARYARTKGFNYRTVLIVGTGTGAAEMVEAMEYHPYWGFKILGFVASEGAAPPPELHAEYPVLGNIQDILQIVEQHPVDDVIFAVSRRQLDTMEPLILGLHEQGIRTRFTLNIFPGPKSRIELDDLDGIPVLTVAAGPTSHLQLLFKRVLDVTLATALLSLAAPVVLLIAIAIRLTSKGNVVFSQTRCGLSGRKFTLYKFRTMVEGAEQRQGELRHLNEMDGPVFKVRKDPRVTLFGRFLRKFSLDELPQLWNVLRGDMSLVGPRPPVPEEVIQYKRWQRRRLSMKPGLTCLWQISGRNEIDFDRWMELDLEYIDTWSPGLDFKILLKTIPVVLSGKGAS